MLDSTKHNMQHETDPGCLAAYVFIGIIILGVLVCVFA